MNKFNFSSRTKDFSKGFVYKNQRAITLSKANFCMKIQPELTGWSEVLKLILTNQNEFINVYRKSDSFQLLIFNHLMLYHSAHQRE